jgi:putative OPT family oligopeptide transporter
MKSENIIQNDQTWYEKVYQGNRMPELTIKVLVTGSIMAVLLIASNIYMGLKTGMMQGGSIIAAIVTFSIVKLFKGSFSILENNMAQTMASAAATLGIMVSAVPALILLGFEFSATDLFIWILTINIMGVLFAIPLRKQYVVLEQITFPSGIACAETIKSLHAQGDSGIKKAKILTLSGVISAILTWFRDGLPSVIPYITAFPGKISGYASGQLTLGLSWSPMLLGVGFLVGPRIGISLLFGAAIGWGILAPFLADSGYIEALGYPLVKNWTMWPAVALMVVSGVVTLLINSGSILRAFKHMGKVKVGDEKGIEISFKQWLLLILAMTVIICVVMQFIFSIPAWMTLLAIILSYIFASIAVRAYGETDINPVGAMGYGTQIVYGGLAPGNTLTNVMAAGITASGANQAADMMQDFKTGYILGATPKKQTWVQIIGVTLGSIVAVPVFFAIEGAYGLASEFLPAPSAVTWSGMAELLSKGFSALPAQADLGIIIGALLGLLISLISQSKWKKFLPSAFALGIALFLPAFISITIFLGSMIKYFLDKKYPAWMESYAIPLATGGIVGEAMIGILISILLISGLM